MVRTPGSHPDNTGSIPVEITKKETLSFFFYMDNLQYLFNDTYCHHREKQELIHFQFPESVHNFP